jgi:hypothetical protein
MPLLPVLVSIFTFNKRKQFRDAQNKDGDASRADNSAHTKIDIPLSDTHDEDNTPSNSSEKPINPRTAPRGRPMR